MITFEVPNLDDQWASDLKSVSEVLHSLGTYAELRSQAVECRAAGRVQHALELEGVCDTLYKNLPDWAKW